MRILIKTSSVFFLSIFLFHTAIEAQTFEKLNGPGGGGSKVYEGRNGILFQIIDDTEYYSSVNGGSSWTRMPPTPDGVWLGTLSVGLDGNLFCAKFKTLYKSTNDGQSWDSINYPGYYILTATSLPDGTILVGSNDQVWKSVDNGQNWHSSNKSEIHQFFYNSANAKVYAINEDNLYVSNDKGSSWQLSYSDDFGDKYFDKNLIVASDGTMFVTGFQFIWKFDATGNFIKKIDMDLKHDPILSPVDLAIIATDRLFAFHGYSSYYSDDLGETWVDMFNPADNYSTFYAFATTKNGVLFGVNDYGGLFRSADGGKTWIFSAQGMPYSTPVEIDFISESKLLVLTLDGLFYSEDGGNTWTFLLKVLENSNIYGERSHVVNFGEEFYCIGFNAIYYFKDWKTSPVVIPTITDTLTYEFGLFINPFSGNLFYTSNGQFYKSTDKGFNWSALQINDVRSFKVLPDGSIIVVCNDGIYKSSDDGENWDLKIAGTPNNFASNTKIMSNSFSSAFIIHFGNNSLKLSSSDDYGTSWSTEDLNPSKPFELDPTSGEAINNVDYLYVAGDTGDILVSLDRGLTFNKLAKLNGCNALSISPEQKLYALTYRDGLHRTTTATSSAKILKGNVFDDLNLNCDKNVSEIISANRLVVASNGADKKYGYSRKNGSFSIPIENGNYVTKVVTDNDNWISCDKTIPSASYNFNDTLLLGLQVKSLCPYLNVDIQSSALRRCFETNLYVNYSNTGTVKADDAIVDITLDPFFEFISSSIPISSQNGNVCRFQLGAIEENSNDFFTIQAKISCDAKLGQIHCAEAHIYPDTSCIQTSQAIIRTNANCIGDSIDFIIKNEGTKAMASVRKWSAVDATSASNLQTIDAGNFYLDPGQVFTKKISSRAKVLLTAEQDESYPFNKYSKTEIVSCASNPSPGSVPLNIYRQDEEEPFISKFCEPNRGSFDPNDITGYPYGLTDKRFVDQSQELEYIIRFQNTGTDTAFTVRIENELPVNELDIATLALGASSHPYEYLLDSKGKLIFTFKNILLPDSNIHEKASHGFIQYRIKPVNKLSNGTRILNDASIYFDFNEAVNTNVDLHTIGSPGTVKVNDVADGNKIDFQIKPNPLHDFSSVLINDVAKHERYKLSCVDVFSKEIWEMDVMGNKATISKGEMKPGVYFLILKTENGLNLKSRKFIVN